MKTRNAADVVLGLGANLGEPAVAFADALAHLDALAEVRLLAMSALYRSAALGPPQADYINAAARIETTLRPLALLAETRRIETAMGRVRRQRWGPRVIDIDILLWEAQTVDLPGLIIPHPGLWERNFALAPALEVGGDLDPRLSAALSRLGGPPERVEADFSAIGRPSRQGNAD